MNLAGELSFDYADASWAMGDIDFGGFLDELLGLLALRLSLPLRLEARDRRLAV